MRKGRALVALAAALGFIFTLHTPAIATVASSSGEFWLTTTTNDGFDVAVLRAADHTSGGRETIVDILTEMRDSPGTTPLALPKDAGPTRAEQNVSLARVISKLKDGERAPAPAAGTYPGNAIAAPQQFPIRGTNRTWWWEDMPYIIQVLQCQVGGCVIRDQLTVRTTVNPGAVASRIDYNVLYSPNAGNLQTRHLEFFAMCRSSLSVCSQGNVPSSGSLPANGSFTVYQSSMRGQRLTHGFTLWAQNLRAGGAWIGDSARTGPAFCNTHDNVCLY